jgi:hypothetical protein
LENERSIHIQGANGDVIGIDVSGSGNVIGKNITISSLGLSNNQLQKIPKEYADSLKAFTDAINLQFKDNSIPSDKVAEVQKNVDEFSKELEGVKAGQELGIIKKTSLKSKFVNIAKAALTTLPKTLQVITAFTPLAPFSGLIGEDTQLLVQAIQNDI